MVKRKIILSHFLLLTVLISGELYSQSKPTTCDNKGWDRSELGTGDHEKYLTQDEKDVIYYLNMARTNPERYAEEFLEPMLGFFKGTKYKEPGWDYYMETKEGKKPLEELIVEMKRMNPVGKLLPARGLSLAARDHASDQSVTGEVGHTGKDRSDIDERIERYGKWKGNIGENISYGFTSGRDIVSQLLIDDGVPNRGHRVIIFSEDFRFAGISILHHKKYSHICVIDFAQSFFPDKKYK